MKLKYLYLGLLSTLVMAGQTEAMNKFRQMKEAPETHQKLREHEDLQAKIEPMLDLAGHGGDQEAAAQDIVDNVGKHPTKASRSGKTVNHKIADLNARIGTKGAHATGPSAHEKLTDLMAVQGAVSNGAAIPGAKTGVVGVNAGDLAGTAIKNEEKILARLKAWAGAQDTAMGAGRAIQAEFLANTTTTPGTNPAAGTWLVQADWAAAAAAGNMEAFLAALGM